MICLVPFLLSFAFTTVLSDTADVKSVIYGDNETATVCLLQTERPKLTKRVTQKPRLKRSERLAKYVTFHGVFLQANSAGGILGWFHVVAALAALGAIFWHTVRCLFTQDEQVSEPIDQEGRSALLDNVKWIAQFLVIYNHVLYYESEAKTQEPWLHGAQSLLVFLNGNFMLVVNPLFCFISGVVSQGAPTVRRLCRYVQFLIIPTFVWHYVVGTFVLFLANPSLTTLTWLSDMETPEQIKQRIIADPFMADAPWYLLSLCLWRGSVYLLWSRMQKPHAFICMCVLSCAGGYVAWPGMSSGFHGFNTTSAYLPHFGLGYVFPFQKVADRVPKPSVMASIFVCAVIFSYASMFQYFGFLRALPDGHGWYGCCGQDINLRFWWCRRLVKVFLDLLTVMLLVFLVIPRRRGPLTYAGPHTLYSYLFQGAATAWRVQLFRVYPPRTLTNLSSHIMVLTVFYVPWSLTTLLIFTSTAWRTLFGWALTPTWLDRPFAILEQHLTKQFSVKSAAASILPNAKGCTSLAKPANSEKEGLTSPEMAPTK